MIMWLFRSFFYLLGIVVFLYFLFFIPLGKKTLFEHLQQIAQTDEAQELKKEVSKAAVKLESHIETKYIKSQKDPSQQKKSAETKSKDIKTNND